MRALDGLHGVVDFLPCLTGPMISSRRWRVMDTDTCGLDEKALTR